MSSSAGAGDREERRAADLAAGVTARAADLAQETTAKADDLAQETTAKADDLAEVTAGRALALASALSDALAEIGRRLDQYSAFGRRSRRIIIALAGSFTLDIILTVALGLTAVSAHGTADTNAQLVQGLHTQQAALQAAQLMACANGNVFRDNQTTIWRDFIVIITRAETGQSAAQVAKSEKLAAEFLAYVAKVNHPVNCAALYGK